MLKYFWAASHWKIDFLVVVKMLAEIVSIKDELVRLCSLSEKAFYFGVYPKMKIVEKLFKSQNISILKCNACDFNKI